MSTGQVNHITMEPARLTPPDSFSAGIIALTYERKLSADTGLDERNPRIN